MRYLLIILLFVACNPIKRVVNDPKKFELMKEIVVRSGACANDTVVVSKDSIVYKDSLIEKKIQVPCADFDSTFGDTRISVRSGVLTYEHKCKEKTVTKTITNNIRDRALENILKSDIKKMDSVIGAKERVVKDKESEIKSLRSDVKSLKGDVRTEKFKFWLLVAGIGVFIFRKPLLRVIGL
jgi:hypothetical protein